MSVGYFRANNQKQLLNDVATKLLLNFQLFVVLSLKQRSKMTYTHTHVCVCAYILYQNDSTTNMLTLVLLVD